MFASKAPVLILAFFFSCIKQKVFVLCLLLMFFLSQVYMTPGIWIACGFSSVQALITTTRWFPRGYPLKQKKGYREYTLYSYIMSAPKEETLLFLDNCVEILVLFLYKQCVVCWHACIFNFHCYKQDQNYFLFYVICNWNNNNRVGNDLDKGF